MSAKERIQARKNRRKRRRLLKKGKEDQPDQPDQLESEIKEKVPELEDVEDRDKELSKRAKKRLRKNWLRRKLWQLQNPAIHWQDKEEIRKEVDEFNEARRRSQEQKKIRKQQEREVQEWLENNSNEIDPNKYKQIWEHISKQKRDQFLNLIVSSLATAEGALLAEDSVKYGLGLQNAGMDISELNSLSSKIFKIASTHILLDSHGINGNRSEQILSRVLAREFPVRDGENKGKDLSQMLANELRPSAENPDPYGTGARGNAYDKANSRENNRATNTRASMAHKSRPMKSSENSG